MTSHETAVVESLQSHGEYLGARPSARLESQEKVDAALVEHLRGGGRIGALCSLCRAEFDLLPEASDDCHREGFLCRSCSSNARIRSVILVLRSLQNAMAFRRERIYITEQCSPFFGALKRFFGNVVGSEFFGEDHRESLQAYLQAEIAPGERLNFQDLTALDLPADSFHYAISCDVLEHVPDYRAALSELKRILVRDGSLIFTVPFAWDQAETRVRARIGPDGEVEHLLEPEYHGDPNCPGGILAFYNYGWSLLEDIRTAGFSAAEALRVWSPMHGVLGQHWVIVARA